MCNLMCIETTTANEHDTDDETSDEEEKIDLIMKNMWKFNQTYKLSTERLTDDEREPIWYIMDEFGSSIRHSDEPTVSCAPFYYLPSQTMYSIIWPLKNLECGGRNSPFLIFAHSFVLFYFKFFLKTFKRRLLAIMSTALKTKRCEKLNCIHGNRRMKWTSLRTLR